MVFTRVFFFLTFDVFGFVGGVVVWCLRVYLFVLVLAFLCFYGVCCGIYAGLCLSVCLVVSLLSSGFEYFSGHDGAPSGKLRKAMFDMTECC